MTRTRAGLVVFDFDGTLTRGPTVCELLAAPLGRLARMKELEGLSSEEDIALARVEMASWYRGVPEPTLRAALDALEWAPGTRAGVRMLQAHGIEVAIASITWRFALEWLAGPLAIPRILGTAIDARGAIEHVWPRDKARWLRELAAELGVAHVRTAAVGDSPSDAELLSEASHRVYVGLGSLPAVDRLVHAPGASIEGLAEELLAAWAE